MCSDICPAAGDRLKSIFFFYAGLRKSHRAGSHAGSDRVGTFGLGHSGWTWVFELGTMVTMVG